MNTIGRNDPCWCGSGKKYKKCHWQEDQQRAAQRAAVERARQARLEAAGHPSDAEVRQRYELMTGRAAPPGPLSGEARDTIVSMWQQEQLNLQARAALEPERAHWESYFADADHAAEFDEIAANLGRDSFFDRYQLTDENRAKVLEQLGPSPDEADARRAHATEAIALSLDEEDRATFYEAVSSLLPELIEEERFREAFVVATCADRVLDPAAPLSPFMEDVVTRSLRDT